MSSLLIALGAMFLQQTFASVGKVLPAVVAPLVIAEFDADPAWVHAPGATRTARGLDPKTEPRDRGGGNIRGAQAAADLVKVVPKELTSFISPSPALRCGIRS